MEVVDGSDHVIMPDSEQGESVVRMAGLNLPADTHVAVYDEFAPGAYTINATIDADGDAIGFELLDATIYDIVTVEPLPEQEGPAEDETEEPVGEATEEPAGA